MERHFIFKSPKIILFLIVSTLTLVGLLVAVQKVNTPVLFADPNLEAVVREKIRKPTNPIHKSDLMSVIRLDASGRDIHSLEGIQALRRLTKLNLTDNAIEDLRPLAKLKMLSELDLSSNRISNLEEAHIDQLSGSPIRVLNLRHNEIQDITLLEAFVQLEKLNLRENLITDITPVGNLTSLAYLNIHSNPIEQGVGALGNLTALETLIMRNVFIGENYAFLENMTKLTRLNIRNSGITNVAVLGKLMKSGALQDNPAAGITATIDLLQIDPDENGEDPYRSLRRYWDNISNRYPLSLPYYPSQVRSPQFSHESGFYEEAFMLAIITDEPGASIFYTLNGSEPALTPQLEPMPSTFKYVQPIPINKLSLSDDSISLIRTSVGEESPNKDLSETFIGNVIRALVVTPDGTRSDVITQSYFVDDDIQQKYTMPVMSIAVNPEHFFDDEIGIYVPGNLYEDIFPDSPWWNPANYSQRGLKWERPISLQMFSPEGNILISQNMGVRINGRSTRMYSQKSLRLLPGSNYDSQSILQYDFFSTFNTSNNESAENYFTSLILRNSGNDWHISSRWRSTMFRDAMSQSLLKNTSLDIQRSHPVIVFLNGEYWGIHNVRTRYDKHYFNSYYDIKENELIILKGSKGLLSLESNETDPTYINLLKLIDENYEENNFKTTNALANEKIYDYFSTWIDLENFIAYNISHIYFDNTDWNFNDIIPWRKNVDPLEPINKENYGHDGKWRWVIKDTDFSFFYPANNTMLYATREADSDTFLFRALLENEGFKHQFINSFADFLNTIFREDIVINQINEFENLYAPEAMDHINRWGNMGGSFEGWLENVQSMREFAALRPGYIRQHLMDYFNLSNLAEVTIQTNPQHGSIRINSIELVETTVGVNDPSNWNGVYFQTVPIEIEAIPFDGYHFVRWEGLIPDIIDIESEIIQINLQSDLTLIALFEKNIFSP